MRSDGEDHVMLDLKVLRICEVIYMEKILDFFNTTLSQVYDLVLLADDVVSGLCSSDICL